MHDLIRLSELFFSIQGESTFAGLPTVFVRLTGCPLRCTYCDTAYAFKGGDLVTLTALQEKIAAYQCNQVCITGGEPLAQPACLNLITSLCDAGYTVSIETSGALDVSEVDSRATLVMDLKTPDSGECSKNKWSNLDCLKPTDQIKFVLCSREDYLWTVDILATHQLHGRCHILLSPSWNQLNPTSLAEWILEDKLPVRLQLQLHKILWNDERGH